ncbi:hypothetical protein ACIQLG_16735 [Terribacillus saccharophilus]|uniref:hypothetical protein n=1 Tax=Terribacillus saccharophilus TaxID=361277 RepID=UPI003811BF43
MTKKLNSEQTDIFSLFAIPDEYAEEQKKKDEERKKEQEERLKTTKEAANKKDKKDEFTLNTDTKIYFYAELIDVNEYFSIEELTNGIPNSIKAEEEITYKKVSERELLKRLKKDYPVLDVSTGAQAVYIKSKNAVSIILQAKKKGSAAAPTHGLVKTDAKIPFGILKDFIYLAKRVYDLYGTEFHADIYLDHETNEFFLDIPEQEVTGVTVEVTEDELTTALRFFDRKCTKYMEIHSHHIMKPIPSPLDNASERMPIYYGIVGCLDEYLPQLSVRTFDLNKNQHISFNPSLIFEDAFSSSSPFYDLSVVKRV